jgi:hypothetical protein
MSIRRFTQQLPIKLSRAFGSVSEARTGAQLVAVEALQPREPPYGGRIPDSRIATIAIAFETSQLSNGIHLSPNYRSTV